MEFVGKYLKKSRIARKIDIETVTKNLNISFDTIEKIEEDEFPEYLNKVYLTGHIRAYAKYLGLNSNEVVKQFKVQISFTRNNVLNEIPKPLVKEYLFLMSPKTVSLFSIIFISVSFYYLFIKSNDLQPNYSILPDLPENFQSEIEEIEMNTALNTINNLDFSNDKFGILNSDQIILIDKPEGIESSAVASLPSNNELSDFNYQIRLKFLKSTWIQLRNEQDQIILSKLMNINDEYSYSVADNYRLTAGNAGNILVLINDKARGKAGKNGEVIESLIIHSDFDN